MSTVQPLPRRYEKHRERPSLHPVPAAGEPSARRVDVSIVVITWNNDDCIDRCLRAIPAAASGLAYEIIVLDNASKDSTLAIARETTGSSEELEAEIVSSEQNLGFAGGMNAAIGYTRGQFLFLLNPDCELQPLAITRLVKYVENDSKIGAAAPMLVGDDGQAQREFQLRRIPSIRTLVSESLLLHRLLPGNPISRRYRCDDLDISRAQQLEQPPAAALLIRREVFENVGSMDERFSPAWFEDVDYCKRIWSAGYSIHFVPEAKATHRGGACLDHVEFGEFLSIWYRNLFRYARKWHSPADVEILRIAIMAGMVLRGLAVATGIARKPDWRDSLRAYSRVIREAFHRWDESRSS